MIGMPKRKSSILKVGDWNMVPSAGTVSSERYMENRVLVK
jgi:hypothetical protein